MPKFRRQTGTRNPTGSGFLTGNRNHGREQPLRYMGARFWTTRPDSVAVAMPVDKPEAVMTYARLRNDLYCVEWDVKL